MNKPNSEEKKIEKLLKKTSREIYKLRKSRKKQPDISSFRFVIYFFIFFNQLVYKFKLAEIVHFNSDIYFLNIYTVNSV